MCTVYMHGIMTLYIQYAILQAIDSGQLPMWANLPAPDVAIKYWKLPVSVRI